MKVRTFLISLLLHSFAYGETWFDMTTGIIWNYEIIGNEACIYKGVEQPAISLMSPQSVTIPTSLGGKQVTAIGDYAFYNCWAITTVKIPTSVKSIGAKAFCRCWGMTSITIPINVNAMSDDVFEDCWGLEEIKVATGNRTFSSSNGVLYNSSKSTVIRCPQAKQGGISLESTVTQIGVSAFNNCSMITGIQLPSRVKTVGDYAFYGCSGITSLEIPAGVTAIGEYAFSGCDHLAQITLPENLRRIESHAFSHCSAIVNLTLPSGVTNISCYAFCGCEKLALVSMPAKLMEIGEYAFWGCCALKSVDIPESTTVLGRGAFSDCEQIQEASIPDYVTVIPQSAFSGCFMLRSITIPAGVTDIGWAAFSDCNALRVVVVDRGDVDRVRSLIQLSGFDASALSFEEREPKPIIVPTVKHNVLFRLGEHGTRTGGGRLTQSVTNGCAAIAPEVLVEQGWRLCGWDKDFSCVTNGFIINAIYCAVNPDGKYSEFIDGIEWTYVIVNGVAIVGGGDLNSPAVPTSTSGAIAIPSILGGCDVVGVGNYAFYKCKKILSVEMPNGITEIGEWAFYQCEAIRGIDMPMGVMRIGIRAFKNCTSLAKIVIPESVIHIGGGAFEFCTNLVSANIPTTMTEINGLFYECSSLRTIIIPEGITKIGDHAFYRCASLNSIVIPNSVAKISTAAFTGTELRTVEIPSNVVELGDYAFYDCKKLTSVQLRNGVESIGSSVFKDCVSLKQIDIPSSVRKIGSAAFSNCNSLSKVVVDDLCAWALTELADDFANPLRIATELSVRDQGEINFLLPSSLDKVDDYRFRGCSSLLSVVIPCGVKSIGRSAFENCRALKHVSVAEEVAEINDFAFRGCESLELFNFPDLMSAIGENAFEGCARIKDVCLPVALSNLGADAFRNCTSIESMTIPANVKYISDRCFKNCENLTQISLPDDLRGIGVSAFEDCAKLVSIRVPRGVSGITFTAFNGCSNLRLIEVDANNVYFSSKNGILYNKDGTTIIRVPEGMDGVIDIPTGVLSVGDYSFWGCDGLAALIVPDGVYAIGDSAFSLCVNLETINLPTSIRIIGTDAFFLCHSLATIYVGAGDGRRIISLLEQIKCDTSNVRFVEDGTTMPLLSENADPDLVMSLLLEAKDSQLVANIFDAATYRAFRNWSIGVGANKVWDSQNAWVCFAIDSPVLLAKKPVNDDLKIVEFKPSTKAGSFDFTVSVKDMTIGDKASVDNLKKLFGLEGAESLDTAAFSSENVSLDFKEPQDGKLRFTATPAVDNAKSFFMKVKVK